MVDGVCLGASGPCKCSWHQQFDCCCQHWHADAADTLGEHGDADATDALDRGEHGYADAADTLEAVIVPR